MLQTRRVRVIFNNVKKKDKQMTTAEMKQLVGKRVMVHATTVDGKVGTFAGILDAVKEGQHYVVGRMPLQHVTKMEQSAEMWKSKWKE